MEIGQGRGTIVFQLSLNRERAPNPKALSAASIVNDVPLHSQSMTDENDTKLKHQPASKEPEKQR
jgi:hypothetical protein